MLKNTVRAGLAATRRVIRVGGVPEHFNAPWHTAAAQGHFDAAGFEVEWTDFPGGTGAMTNALRAGEIDIALALTEGLVADLHLRETTAYKLLGTYVRSPLTWGVHVSADSDRHGMDSLADARYAVSRMGSGSHLMACVDAHARGVDPSSLAYEIVGSLDGARHALRIGLADVFMWEKFTTKFLVDAGEWRRIGEVPTPWPCFSVAASARALDGHGDKLIELLDIVRAECAALRADEACAKTIGSMYAQHEEDVVEWLGGVEWSCRPVVSHATLDEVMGALVEANVLARDKLLPPADLCASLCEDGSP